MQVDQIAARRHRLLGSVCFAAMLSALAAPASAQETAQDTTAATTGETAADEAEANPDAIVVTGIRQNLESAQNRRRYADTVVDAISAEDIGSFPDKSVAEALQRVPGVTVSRFAGSDDTSHFSAEPSSVLVRGLPQVRSELNGRDVFSANSSRGLGFADVAPELLAGIDTYKNQTADLIEGGIAGTINLRTRVPFDSRERVLSLSAEISYGDIARQATPAFSGLYSDRFQTSIGEFGFLASGAYSRVKTASQGIQFDRTAIFEDVFGEGLQYMPSGIWMRDNIYDRERYGIALAGQWQSNDGNQLLTLQYNRSQYQNSWRERSVYTSAFTIYGLPTDYRTTDPSVVAPLQGTDPFTFDDQGRFTSGSWSGLQPYVGEGGANVGLGLNEDGEAFFTQCYSWEGCTNSRRGPQLDTASNALRNDQYTQDFGANFRWDISDRLRVTFDGQYVNSEVHNYNASVLTRSYANTFVDLRGKYPTLTIDPNNADNINLSSGGLTNPNNYHYYAITDHTEDSEGQEIAVRADLAYDFDSDWLSALRVGGRYADRDQTVRWGAYNWANISNNWTYTQAPYFNLDSPVYPNGNYETAGLSRNFFNGNQLNHNEFIFFNMDKLENRESLAEALGRPSIGVGEYYPVCSNAGYRAGETVEDDFGCYLPSEVLTVSERTVATYARLDFGGRNARIGNVAVTGNIGVRLVWTRDETGGAFTFPNAFTADQLPNTCVRAVVDGRPTATTGCVVTDEEIAFNTGATIPGDARADHFHALPSFNLKLDLTEGLVTRFAYSRAMSRPDIGLLRNYVTVSRLAPNLTDLDNPHIIFGPNGEIAGYDFQYQGRAGNPRLKPITANQFDLAMEYYFSPVGSITATAFYKQFENYIQSGTYNLEVTNNGVTRDVLVQGPTNGEGASIYGIEISGQTFFDFLPAPFSGFGVQANYTYVNNNGIQTTHLTSETAGGTAGGGVSYDTTAVKPDALEGISTHTFNLVGMYERGPLSARVAYNWRSRYLVTAIDCCIGLPIWQQSSGYLDASLRFRPTARVEFSIEASNLLGTDTVLMQQVDNEGTLQPNAWYKNDRRFQLGVRFTL